MLSIEVRVDTGDSGLYGIPKMVMDALVQKVRDLTNRLHDHVVADKLQGQVLNHRTGALGRSIQQDVQSGDNEVQGKVFSAGDVKYAAIQEFGGTTPPHDIYPDKAQALAFMMGGKQVFAKVVHHPGSKIPERSYLRSSLADMSDIIVSEIKEAVINSAKGASR